MHETLKKGGKQGRREGVEKERNEGRKKERKEWEGWRQRKRKRRERVVCWRTPFASFPAAQAAALPNT